MKLKSKILTCVALTILCSSVTPRSLAMFGVQKSEPSPASSANPAGFAVAPKNLFSQPDVPAPRGALHTPQTTATKGGKRPPITSTRTKRSVGSFRTEEEETTTITRSKCGVGSFITGNPMYVDPQFQTLNAQILRQDTKKALSIIATTAPEELSCKEANGRTPLHEAVNHENLEVVEALIDKRVHINELSYDGLTPLELALSNRDNPGFCDDPKKLNEIIKLLEINGGIDTGKRMEMKVLTAYNASADPSSITAQMNAMKAEQETSQAVKNVTSMLAKLKLETKTSSSRPTSMTRGTHRTHSSAVAQVEAQKAILQAQLKPATTEIASFPRSSPTVYMPSTPSSPSSDSTFMS